MVCFSNNFELCDVSFSICNFSKVAVNICFISSLALGTQSD